MTGYKPKDLGICFCCGKPISPAIGKYGITISKLNFHRCAKSGMTVVAPLPLWEEVGQLTFHISCFLSVAGEKFCPPGSPRFCSEDLKQAEKRKKK